MKKFHYVILLAIITNISIAKDQTIHLVQYAIDLSGEWRFQIDSLDKGVEQQWFNRKLSDAIKLPGSMATNGKGNEVDTHTPWIGNIIDSSWFSE